MHLSREETDFFGFRIFRETIINSSQFGKLENELQKKDIDVLRLKVGADLLETEQRLSNLDILYHFAGGSIQYEIPTTKIKYYSPPCKDWNNIQFERFNGQQQVFSYLLNECWKHDPVGYFRTPKLNEHITREWELEFLKYYYTRESYFKQNYIYLLKKDGNYLGFAIYEINENSGIVYSPLAGILPNSTNRSYFSCIVRHAYNFVMQQNQETFHCGARLHNMVTQHVFERDRMEKSKVLYYYHLLPKLERL